MSRQVEWDGGTLREIDRRFRYDRGRLTMVQVRNTDWQETGPMPGPDDIYGFVEVYAYNMFGERVGVLHCTDPLWDQPFPEPMIGGCKPHVKVYDYVDGRVLAERQRDEVVHPKGEPVRYLSIYTWGLFGVVARRGVSFRNGYWDENNQAFVSQDPDVMSDYTYMKDHMGNVVGLTDSSTGESRLQRFDAFGNNVGGYVRFQCASDHDNADQYASVPAEPVERMQTGQFNWRGGEGSATDWISEDALDRGAPPAVRSWAYATPSTGLVYMNARYYDPAVGRFTQADPLPYGPEAMWGQNNRWTYCANDPVNWTDATGRDYGGFGAVAASFGYMTGYFVMSNGLGLNPLTYWEAFLAWSVDIGLSAVAGLFVGNITTAAMITCNAFEGVLLGAGLLAAAGVGYWVGMTMALAFAIEQGIF